MKKSRIIIAAAFAATMFSCTKETIVETPKVSLTFNVTNESSATKAALNANAVEFQAGDKIGVWDGAGMNIFETTAGGANASFSGDAASAATYILVSPYNENYSVNGSVVTYSIPDIQVATPGSADPNALVSMAKVNDPSADVTLYNCVGLIKVVVPDGLVVKEIDPCWWRKGCDTGNLRHFYIQYQQSGNRPSRFKHIAHEHHADSAARSERDCARHILYCRPSQHIQCWSGPCLCECRQPALQTYNGKFCYCGTQSHPPCRYTQYN